MPTSNLEARREIKNAYERELGRPASEAEINARLTRLFGDRANEQIRGSSRNLPQISNQQLRDELSGISNSEEARRFRSGEAITDLATPPTPQPLSGDPTTQAVDALRQVLAETTRASSDIAAQRAEQARTQGLAERAGIFDQIEELSPRLQGIRRAGEDPAVTAIRELLGQQVLTGLEAGTDLTDEESRLAEQSIRSAQGARGLLGGRGGAAVEAVERALRGIRRGRERRAEASQFLAHEAAASPDPFSSLLRIGTPSVAVGAQAGGSPFSAAIPALNVAQNQQQLGLATTGQRQAFDLFKAIEAPKISSLFSGNNNNRSNTQINRLTGRPF